MSVPAARRPAWERMVRFFAGASLSGALPRRIYDDVRRQQFRAEILIAVVQLAIVAFFSVMYFVVPATFAPGAPVRATPLGL